jgi:hypothetical protein
MLSISSGREWASMCASDRGRRRRRRKQEQREHGADEWRVSSHRVARANRQGRGQPHIGRLHRQGSSVDAREAGTQRQGTVKCSRAGVTSDTRTGQSRQDDYRSHKRRCEAAVSEHVNFACEWRRSEMHVRNAECARLATAGGCERRRAGAIRVRGKVRPVCAVTSILNRSIAL